MSKPDDTEISDNRICFRTKAGKIDLDRNGCDLLDAVNALIDKHWEERGYRHNDGTQTLNALTLILSEIIAGIPQPQRTQVIRALPEHVVDISEVFADGVSGELVDSVEDLKLKRH